MRTVVAHWLQGPALFQRRGPVGCRLDLDLLRNPRQAVAVAEEAHWLQGPVLLLHQGPLLLLQNPQPLLSLKGQRTGTLHLGKVMQTVGPLHRLLGPPLSLKEQLIDIQVALQEVPLGVLPVEGILDR